MMRRLLASASAPRIEPAPPRAVWWLAGSALVVGAASWLWALHLGDEHDVATAATAASSRFPWAKADADGETRTNASPRWQTGLEELPRSLAGTEVDGQLEADAAGHLKLTRGVRNVFDYFLSTVGEDSLAHVRARLVAYITSHLPPTAAREAEALLDHYLAYEQDQGQAAAQAGSAATALTLDAVSQRFDTLQALRAKHFSAAERAAFFADDEALDRYTLARLRVLQDSSLTSAEKARRLSELTAGLPPAMRADQTVAETVQNLQAITADWKARGGSPQELRSAREQLVGPDATARLEALDRQRSEWAARLQSYQAQRKSLLTDATLSGVQREQALTQLRSRLFSPQEQLRVQTLVDTSPP